MKKDVYGVGVLPDNILDSVKNDLRSIGYIQNDILETYHKCIMYECGVKKVNPQLYVDIQNAIQNFSVRNNGADIENITVGDIFAQLNL